MDLGGGVSAYWRIGGIWWRVACETPELHYIWRSNITEIFSSFPLRDEVVSRRKGYKMVNFLPKLEVGGSRALFRMPAKTVEGKVHATKVSWCLFFL
jgi:hypothetical protein